MKKLAIVITHPIQYYAPVFRLLTERGRVQVRVFYTKTRDEVAFDKGFGQAVAWDIPLLEGYDYQFAGSAPRPLIAAIEAFRPDAVLVFGWNPPGHLAVLRHFKGRTPVWFRGDSTLLDERPGLRRRARRLFLRWVYRYVDRAFYVGTQNKLYFLAHGLKESQLTFAPHAVDNERFFDGPGKDYEARARQWRRELGISDEDFVVLYAGKFEPVKGLDVLIQAVGELNKNPGGRPVKLILAGSGPLENQLRAQAGSSPHIVSLGFQNQSVMPIVYRLGNVFCLPSNSETWGLAVNEAMACGKSVIASDKVGCAVDLVADDCVFKHGNPADLARVIAAQLRQPNDDSTIIDKIVPWSFAEQVKAYENDGGTT